MVSRRRKIEPPRPVVERCLPSVTTKWCLVAASVATTTTTTSASEATTTAVSSAAATTAAVTTHLCETWINTLLGFLKNAN